MAIESAEARVKALRDDSQPIEKRIADIRSSTLPRKHDLLIGFLLKEIRSETPERVHHVWEALARTIEHVSVDRLAPQLRRANLLSALDGAMNFVSNGHRRHLMRAAAAVLSYIASKRSLMKCLSCTAELSLSVIATATIFTERAENANLNDRMWFPFFRNLVDIILFNVHHRQSAKKFNDIFIKGDYLMILRGALYTPEPDEFEDPSTVPEPLEAARAPIGKLLHQTIWSEASLNEYFARPDALVAALQKLFALYGHFGQVAFKCLADARFPAAKHITLANLFLRELLPKTEVDRGVLLKAYHDYLPRPVQAKVIISDDATSTIVYKLIDQLLETPRDCSFEYITLLVAVDLDLILPIVERVMQLLKSYSEKANDFAKVLLNMFVQMRAIDEFMILYAKLPCKIPPIELDLLEAIAAEVSRMTEQNQRNLLESLLSLDSGLESRRLEMVAAVLGGLTKDAPIVKDFTNRLNDCRGHAASLVHFVLSMKQSAPFPLRAPDSEDVYEVQRNLRALELGCVPEEEDLRSLCWTILDLTGLSDFATTLVERWLPVIVPLMTEDECRALADSIVAEEVHDRMSVLESPELLKSIQDTLLYHAASGNGEMLLNIPVEYWQKVVRHKLLDMLTTRDSQIDDVGSRLLIKFAKHGFFAKLDVESFSAFACNDNQELLSVYASHHPPDFLVQVIESEESMPAENMLTIMKICAESDDKIVQEALIRKRADMVRETLPVLIEVGSTARSLSPEESASLAEALDLLLMLQALDRHSYFGPTLAELLESLYREFKANDKTKSISEVLIAIHAKGGINDGRALQLLASMARSLDDAILVLQIEWLLDGPAACGALVHTLPTEAHEELLEKAHAILRPQHYLTLLEAFCGLRADSPPSYLQPCFRQVCKLFDEGTQADPDQCLRILGTLVDRHSRLVRLNELDAAFASLTQYLLDDHTDDHTDQADEHHLQAMALLRTIFERRAHLLKDRYHVVLQTFAILLTTHFDLAVAEQAESKGALDAGNLSEQMDYVWEGTFSTSDFSHEDGRAYDASTKGATTGSTLARTEAFTRLFHTFLSSSRQVSSSPEQFNRALAKHLPWLLIEYIHLFSQVQSAAAMPTDSRRILEETFAYEIMGLCGVHEREMVGAALDSNCRVLFKRLYEDWSKFGRWKET
jgi:hypothetical protein